MPRRALLAALAVAAVSLVASAVATARPSGGDLIEHQVQLHGDIRTESWTDLSTGRRRSISTMGGKTFTESAVSSVDGKMQMDMVFYGSKTWTTFATGVPADRGRTMTQYTQQFRDEVTHGIFTIVGHDQIEGRATVHLRHALSMSTPVGAHAITNDLWVDALTYLPVRQRSSSTGMPSVSEVNYDWLPRTAENLVNLVLVVPAGFKHQSQGPVSHCSGGGSWLTIHPDNTPVTCSGYVTLGHS